MGRWRNAFSGGGYWVCFSEIYESKIGKMRWVVGGVGELGSVSQKNEDEAINGGGGGMAHWCIKRRELMGKWRTLVKR